MAAISGTFSAAGSSALFTPTENVTDVVISNRSGQVKLMAIPPVGDPQMVTDQDGTYEVLTADTAIQYQFVAFSWGENEIDIDYYMGP